MCLVFLPAKAGWTGLEPLRFFTGTVGTLGGKKQQQKNTISPMNTLTAALKNVLLRFQNATLSKESNQQIK